MRSRVRAVMAAAAVLGSATWAQAQCSKDTDCKGDRVCDAGQCTSPAAVAPPAAGSAPATALAAEPSAAAPAAASPPVVQLAPVAVVPPLASSPLAPSDQPMHRRSTPAMVTGIILTSAGPVVWLAGFVLIAASRASCYASAGYASDQYAYSAAQVSTLNGCRDHAVTASYVVLLTGAVMISVGIPLIVYGAKKVPDTNVTATLAPWVARDQAGLQLRVEL